MKRFLAILVAGLALTAMSAESLGDFYNPPFGGNSIYKLANPTMMSGGASATGGAAYTVLPASITFNPALVATEQRSVLNVSWTGLLNTAKADGADGAFGNLFQIGTIVPTRYMVIAATAQGSIVNFSDMDLGNTVLVHAGLSKDVTDKIFVGMNLYTGFYMGSGSDFTVGCDLGFLYLMDDIGFLKRPRLGIALLNMGKPVNGNFVANGINGSSAHINYPGIFTPRASFAASLLDLQGFNIGFSADLYAPEFMDLAFDLGLSLSYSDVIQFCVGWDGDLRELLSGASLNWPSVGLNIRLTVNSKKIAEGNEAWEKSEIVPALAWKNLYGGKQALSAGASLYLGQKDTKAPEIYLWDDAMELVDDSLLQEGGAALQDGADGLEKAAGDSSGTGASEVKE